MTQGGRFFRMHAEVALNDTAWQAQFLKQTWDEIAGHPSGLFPSFWLHEFLAPKLTETLALNVTLEDVLSQCHKQGCVNESFERTVAVTCPPTLVHS
jgi:hypothetical protein